MHEVRTPQTLSVDLESITANLQKANPGTPFAVIETEVGEAAHRYRDATVADFLPVLIERQVRAHLRG